ncbi:PspA/IM30 family protein [Shimazuella alba]|uniref:Phage shock protein A (PspA) family protein n=1 Tax=Shimazuella alba TaxID=2690964 RepID=A0A6I4VY34_9BACL|nr:PspA/IM30 family protein [Shimazuella alba]MXQ54875.1 hypothetical protein [Shimazuella alba]
MGRFRRFFKSTYNQVMNDIENPESILKQYLKDMEKEIGTVKEVISQQLIYLENFKKQQEEAHLLILKREKQAQIASKAREEELAGKALSEKAHYEIKMKEYTNYVTETESGIRDLKEKLYLLEREYLDLEDKKNNLLAQVARAKAQNSIEKTLQSLKSEQFLSDFQRIYDEINTLSGKNKISNKSELEELDEIDLSINKLQTSKVTD